jgi:threonine aldolase
MPQIDLRSDTVTQPTEAMREAMARAEVDDDGLGRDPTTRRLEDMAAAQLGKEAGLFVVSGTACNLVAFLAIAREKGIVLAHHLSHILRAEMGGLGTLAGLFSTAIPGERGAMDLEILRGEIHPKLALGTLPTVLIEVETTHTFSGGRALPLDHLAAVRKLGEEFGIPVHMDGARLFNAAIALGVPVRDVAQYADTVGFCLSKGLSAPVGSVLCGPAAVIERARLLRRMIGGTLRQSGILAAAGIVALEQMVDRLAEDHANAQRLARGLHAVHPSIVDPADVETNLIMLNLGKSGRPSDWFAAGFERHGIRARGNATSMMRMVTHRQVTEADIDRILEVFAVLWNETRAVAA